MSENTTQPTEAMAPQDAEEIKKEKAFARIEDLVTHGLHAREQLIQELGPLPPGLTRSQTITLLQQQGRVAAQIAGIEVQLATEIDIARAYRMITCDEFNTLNQMRQQ